MKFHGVKSIARNASYLAGSYGLSGLMRGVYAIVLARMLGPEIYGMFNYGMSWYLAFIPLTSLGLDAILAREVGRNREKGAYVMERIMTLRSTVSLLIAVICALTGWLVESDETVRYLLLIFSVALFGRALSLWSHSVFSAYEESKYVFQQDTLFRLLEISLGTAVLFLWGELMAVAAVHALVWWMQGLRGLALVRRHLYPVKPVWDFAFMWKLLKQGLPLGIAAIFIMWLQQGPLVLYRHFAGVEQSLGYLALAMQALYLLSGIPASLGRAALPVLSRAVEREDGKDKVYIEGMMRMGFVLGAAGGIAGMALGPWFVPLIFGEQYLHTGKLLGPVLWLLGPLMIAISIHQVIVAHGRYLAPAVCVITGSVVFTIIFPYLISAYDTYGAILAAAIGMITWSGCLVVYLYRFNRIDLGLALFRPGLTVLLAFGLFQWSHSFSPWLALPLAVFGMIAGIFVFGVLSQSEKAVISGLCRNRLARRT